MIKIKKVSTILLAITLLIMLFSGFFFAQGKDLEVNYPNVFGEALNSGTTLEGYIKYIFNFALMISGLVVFGVLVYAGFRYLTSAESPTARADAKSRIISAFLGLIIILCSWLILDTLNPQLTIIKPSIETLCNCSLPKDQWGTSTCLTYCEQITNAFRFPGVYLTKGGYSDGDKCIPDVENGNCTRLVSNAAKLENGFNDKVKKIRFTNTSGNEYVAILHEDNDFKNQCRIFLEKPGQDFQDVPGKDSLGNISKPSSATIFKKGDENQSGPITICEVPSFEDKSKCHEYNYDKTFNTPSNIEPGYDNNVNAIKIDGNFLVVLFENPIGGSFPGICEVFTGPISVSDLKGNPIGRCLTGWKLYRWFPLPLPTYKSCVSSFVVYPIKK